MPVPDAHIGKSLVIVDGMCIFCNRLVQTIIARDRSGHFVFAHHQSKIAGELVAALNIDAIYLVENIGTAAQRVYAEGAAGKRIWPHLYWWAAPIKWVPLFLLNPCYWVFGKIRYRLFGKYEQCLIPTEALRTRMLS